MYLKMSKQNFECEKCCQLFLKWQGCCPNCKSWNTISERQQQPLKNAVPVVKSPQPLSSISEVEFARITTKFSEWDRVLGGGLVPGSINILTGDPGIGKSTLLLQIANDLAQEHLVFYFSSEESGHQVRNRATRILLPSQNLYFLAENNLASIISTIKSSNPRVAVIDSIQNCFFENEPTAAGSIVQLRECALALMQLAKESNTAIIITAHITKEGQMAGPKTLEHMVDAVFYLQGEDRWQIRILRSTKNRFGPVDELGFFEMGANGLREVENINCILLENLSNSPGAAVIGHLEGSRSLLLEIQALTLPSKLALPQRVITGLEHKQVVIIAAILEKCLKIKFSTQDLFFKVSGGVKIKTQGADLGIALALLSSHLQKALPEKAIAFGEISLTGQIKPINHINMHVREAVKFGIKHLIVPNHLVMPELDDIAVTQVRNVYELLNLFP